MKLAVKWFAPITLVAMGLAWCCEQVALLLGFEPPPQDLVKIFTDPAVAWQIKAKYAAIAVLLAPVLEEITFSSPKIPVLSNVTGKPHDNDPSAIKALMLEQVTGTTNWAADVEAAKALGCTRFVEFGPGKVLSGLIKKIDAALTTVNVSDLASLDATLAALS